MTLLSLDNFDRRSNVVSCVSVQPALTRHDWELVQNAVGEHKQLHCNLGSTDYTPRDYWVSYVNRSGSRQSEPSVLFLLFHENEDELNPTLLCFEGKPDEADWRYLKRPTTTNLAQKNLSQSTADGEIEMKAEVATCPEVKAKVTVTPEGRKAQIKINHETLALGTNQQRVPESVHRFRNRKRY